MQFERTSPGAASMYGFEHHVGALCPSYTAASAAASVGSVVSKPPVGFGSCSSKSVATHILYEVHGAPSARTEAGRSEPKSVSGVGDHQRVMFSQWSISRV